MSINEISDYSKDLQQTILIEADVEGAEQMRSEVFTRHLIDLLTEAGEFENAVPCYFRGHGMEVHGYGIDDEDTVNLITTIYTGEAPPVSVSRTEVTTAFRRLVGFWERCGAVPALHERLEESSDAYDMAQHLHDVAARIRRLRLFVITDARSGFDRFSGDEGEDLEIVRSVWDLERLHRLESSGQPREPIEIDFRKRFGAPLPCLPVGGGAEDYDTMLAVFPGEWLAAIYHDYGARLLELNVRSFLQATGKVNRGIRDTLRNEPDRFLAYNNGVSATASRVEMAPIDGGGLGIAAVRDLQIVNGGQTTASVHRAQNTGVDLSSVFIQAKITVIEPSRFDEIVPLISKYANSQNKVSEADLRANDPFHVEIETLSRTVWTPATGAGLRQSRWFYERARGQYRDALSREGTPARQRAWKETHPTSQRFTKTDIAKFENAWAQLPHEVSRGAQKSFTLFMGELSRNPVKPDVAYFQRLIAKAILWKRAERLVSDQHFGGYRANLVAYAIAKLSHATAQRLDLSRVWDAQALDAPVESALIELSHLAWRVLVDGAPSGANITEWAKQENCWRAMRDERWTPPEDLLPLLVHLAPPRSADQGTDPGDGSPAVAACMSLASDGWFALSNWAKETANLQPWHRKLAYDIGIRMSRGRPPSAKQAQHGERILEEAQRLGFSYAEATRSS